MVLVSTAPRELLSLEWAAVIVISEAEHTIIECGLCGDPITGASGKTFCCTQSLMPASASCSGSPFSFYSYRNYRISSLSSNHLSIVANLSRRKGAPKLGVCQFLHHFVCDYVIIYVYHAGAIFRRVVWRCAHIFAVRNAAYCESVAASEIMAKLV